MAKKCSKCGIEKAEADFSKTAAGKLKAECKACAVKRAQMVRAAKIVAVEVKTPYDIFAEKIKTVLESMDKKQDDIALAHDFMVKIVAIGIVDQAQVNQFKEMLLDEVEKVDQWAPYLLIDEAAHKYIFCLGKDVAGAKAKFGGKFRTVKHENTLQDKLIAAKYEECHYIAPVNKVIAPPPVKVVAPPREKTYEDYFIHPIDIVDGETYLVIDRNKEGNTVYKSAVDSRDIKIDYNMGSKFMKVLRKDAPDDIVKKLKETLQCGDFVYVPKAPEPVLEDLVIACRDKKYSPDFDAPVSKYEETIEDMIDDAQICRAHTDTIKDDAEYYIIEWKARTYMKVNGVKAKMMIEFVGERMCKAYDIHPYTDKLIKLEYLKPKH